MQCHNNQNESYFSTRTDFKPFVSPIAFVAPVSQSNRYTEVAPKEAKYLPGEKLLISLHKNRQKEKKKKDDVLDTATESRQSLSKDVDRITKSLSRVLAGF